LASDVRGAEVCKECKGQPSGLQELPAVFRKVTPGNVSFTPKVGDAWPFFTPPEEHVLPDIPGFGLAIPPVLSPIPLGPSELNPRFPPWDTPLDNRAAARSSGLASEPHVRIAGLNSRGRLPGLLPPPRA
jgi:hypothetical protein